MGGKAQRQSRSKGQLNGEKRGLEREICAKERTELEASLHIIEIVFIFEGYRDRGIWGILDYSTILD